MRWSFCMRRRAAARAHIDHRVAEAGKQRHGPERVVDEHPASGVRVTQGGQPGRLEDGLEPVSEFRPAR